jgi:hypothetical protein
MRLTEVADRLYGLPLAQFIPARDEAARSADDATVSASIKKLRKPSTSAHLVNLLVRTQPDGVDELIALGAELRRAQDALAGDELRSLSRQRHQLIGSLIADASRLADRPNEALAREISATLEAALADEGAAAAVRSGRMIKALTSTGFGAVELDGAVALPDELAAFPVTRRLRAVQAPPGAPARTSAARKARDRAAERVALAERALVKADAMLQSRQHDLDAAQRLVRDAEAALARARSARDAAKTAVREARARGAK